MNLLNGQLDISPHDHILAAGSRPDCGKVFFVVPVCLLLVENHDQDSDDQDNNDQDNDDPDNDDQDNHDQDNDDDIDDHDNDDDDDDDVPASKCPQPAPSQPPWQPEICFSSSPFASLPSSSSLSSLF